MREGLADGVCFTGDGTAIHSGPIDGLASPQAIEKIISLLEQRSAGKRRDRLERCCCPPSQRPRPPFLQTAFACRLRIRYFQPPLAQALQELVGEAVYKIDMMEQTRVFTKLRAEAQEFGKCRPGLGLTTELTQTGGQSLVTPSLKKLTKF